jgi:Fe2+ or Zn2+ uptake regulation protein
MENQEITCREKIIGVFKIYKSHLSNENIRNLMKTLYQKTNQNNTIAKELSFLKKEGIIKSYKVPNGHYFEYELLNENAK